MIQELILKSLKDARFYMKEETARLTPSRKSAQPGRINDNALIAEFIKNTQFKDLNLSVVDSEIREMLNPQGTFFDGETFYYNDKYSNLDDRQKVLVFFNELFNFHQGYYDNGNVTPSQATKIKSITLLCLFHIGIVKERVYYAQSKRGILLDLYNAKYPNNDLNIFAPTKVAAKYLYDDLILNNNTVLGIVSNRLESEDIIECEVKVPYLNITEGSLVLNCIPYANKVFYKKQSKGKAKKNGKLVQKHDEIVEIARKFIS